MLVYYLNWSCALELTSCKKNSYLMIYILLITTSTTFWLQLPLLPKLQISGGRISGLLTITEQLLRICTPKVNYPDILWLLLTTVKNKKIPAQWT